MKKRRNKIRGIKRVLTAFLALVLLFMTSAMAYADDTFFVADENGDTLPVPAAYEVSHVIKNLEEYGFLSHPEDLFLDKEGYLYVADTDNNRILKMERSGKVVSVITEAFGQPLNKPRGVYVHETDNSIWIADTGNQRVVSVFQDGSERKAYFKPDSALLESNFTFDPQKIYASKTGYIYALKGANLMTMDEQNQFRGYLGAANVPFSLQRLLIRTFGTQSQIERTLKQEPAAYTNFMIGSDGMVYGILANAKTAQIRKLNTVGNNTYPEQMYGFSISYDGTNYLSPMFADIAVESNGIISLVDNNTGLIYQYDQEGNLLTAFGGLGDAEGRYQIPSSIVADQEGRLYVLDYQTNSITVYEPTNFIQMVHQAVTLYGDGRYQESKAYWEEVKNMDSNYALAHKGIGKVLYKEEKYKEAMSEYRLAADKEGYSKAFVEYRHEMFRQYFGWIMLCAGAILFGAWKLLYSLKKKSDQWAERIEMGGDL